MAFNLLHFEMVFGTYGIRVCVQDSECRDPLSPHDPQQSNNLGSLTLMESAPPVTLTKKDLEVKWRDLLGATLEAWAHLILYVRKVYDAESFSSPESTLFGLRLFLNRHPQVASYIADAIKVALPSIIAHVADSITLIITETSPPIEPVVPVQRPTRSVMDLLSQAQQDSMSDEEDENADLSKKYMDAEGDINVGEENDSFQPHPIVLEKYELRFPQGADVQRDGADSVYTLSVIEYLEREMREILLSVISMKDVDEGVASHSDSVSFRLVLHVAETNTSCAELNQAFVTGAWRIPPKPSRSSFQTEKTPYVIRPLHSMDAFSSPVGAVHFSVKYPRALPTETSNNRGTPQAPQHLSRDSQSTPTLDF